MPVVLNHTKTVFLHIPKTGGSWARQAMENAGVRWTEYLQDGTESSKAGEDAHLNYQDCQKVFPDSHRFTIVRNPFYWYESYWSMVARNNYDADGNLKPMTDWKHPMDTPGGYVGPYQVGHAWTFEFNGFILQSVERFPSYLTGLFSRFADYPNVSVLKNEFLCHDLYDILTRLGEPFDADALRNTPRENEGARRPEIRNQIVWSVEAVDKIAQTERHVLIKYNYGIPEDLQIQ